MNYYGTTFWSPTDLTHHGVLGMKWGVRRYQNKDGSLTAAGKKHYGTSGLNDKSAKKLESRISDLSNRKSYFEVKGSYKKRQAYQKKTSQINRDVIKTSFDLVKKSDKLSGIIDELKKCEEFEESAYEKWFADKSLVKKTADEYIKKTGQEEYADYYRNVAGVDAAANLWSYYVSKTPELKNSSDRRWELSNQFRSTSKDIFSSMMGKYGKTKLSSVKWGRQSPTISEYLSNKANDYLDDYVIDGEIIFSKK